MLRCQRALRDAIQGQMKRLGKDTNQRNNKGRKWGCVGAVVMPRWSQQQLKWTTALLLCPLLLDVSGMNQTAKAGLFQPLIRLLQPKLEARLVSECRQLAKQALNDVASELAPESWLNNALEEPCRTLARPVSECLIKETSRSGRELGVLTELLRGKVGDDASVVIQRCLTSLTGLPQSSLNQVPLQELMERLRQ